MSLDVQARGHTGYLRSYRSDSCRYSEGVVRIDSGPLAEAVVLHQGQLQQVPGGVPPHPRPRPVVPVTAWLSLLWSHGTRNSWQSCHSPTRGVVPLEEVEE